MVKGVFYIILITLVLMSCNKKDYDNYTLAEPEEEVIDTTHWEYDYTYAGTLPSSEESENDLVNTKWVLTKYVISFATEYPMDTIEFLTNTTYQITSPAGQNYPAVSSIRTYTLSNVPNSTSKELQLNHFYPFGAYHYSTRLSELFIEDGVINNAEFTSLYESSKVVRAWFVKI